MGKKKLSKLVQSPTVKAATSLKRKYGTGSLSPGRPSRVRRVLIDVEQGRKSITQAARDTSLSVSYLRRRLSGEVKLDSRNGPPPVFNRTEEEAMATWLKEMAERGMGLKPCEFLDFIKGIVDKDKRPTPFKNNRPSYKWYHNFMTRNAHIVQLRNETLLESSRSKLTREGTDTWYSKFKDFLIDHGLLHKPQSIFNADETGFNMASKAGKVIGPIRTNQNTSVPHVSGGPSKQRLTVMFCASADGSMIPPFLIYPEPKPRGYNVLTGGIVGSDVAFTKKGWMDASTYKVFLEHFNKHANKDRPVVLLIDSVSSHISMSAFEAAKENGILLYRIIPNATHLMQPLDKGVFGPLKQKWYQVARVHSRQHPGIPIGKESFSEKLKEAYQLFYKPLTIINSFKSSGIYPVDSTVIRESHLKPGLTYHDKEETEVDHHAKITKCSQEQIEAQGALRAFETVLTTPIKRKYEQRIEEGFDIAGQSPCFDVYKKLKAASVGQSMSKQSETYPDPDPMDNLDHNQNVVEPPSCLDILANVALQQQDNELNKASSDILPTTSGLISPVIQDSLVMPKSAKPKKMAPKRLVHNLPDHLTSVESVRMMALREISKIRNFAEKEKRAKIKYIKERSAGDKKSKKQSSRSKRSKKRVDIPDEDQAAENDEEDATCSGCGGSWKEDTDLGLERTWVNCDKCDSWLHTECCPEVDIESDFCCPECAS